MRNFRLYPKLAAQSIRNNRKFYLPYILALLGDTAAIYIMQALTHDPGMTNITPGRPNGYYYVEMMMTLGIGIAFFFSAIFVFYINGFLMKQRKKELGLYNILGMGKPHIAVVLAFETLMVGVLGIGGGFLAGVVLHKLMSLILCNLVGIAVPFGFYICWDGMAQTALLFAGLLAATLLMNLNKVRVSNPIELLRGGNVGEREPKTRWVLTPLGVVSLGAGYYIAITARTGMEALAWYFVAVGLVMIGTYCLFTAVSIFVLKALRKNKKYYYQTGHFIGISGMLYRMKQNAVGLANICILCTMVMVMLSGTLSLYLGTEDMVNGRYPGDVNVYVYYFPDREEESFRPDAMLAAQLGFVESRGVPVSRVRTSQSLSFGAGRLPDGSYTTDRFAAGTVGSVVEITWITEDEYTAVTGETLDLQPGEIAAYGAAGDELTIHWTVPGESREVGATTYPIARKLKSNPSYSPVMVELVTVVAPDMDAVHEIWAMQKAAYGEGDLSAMQWRAHLDLDCDEDAVRQLEDGYNEAVRDDGFYDGTGYFQRCFWKLRCDEKEEAYGLAGGFLFLGLFLGFIFLMATVLIIYYKQVSEGYEDKERFEIMQKVGLSRGEVKRSIHSQILMVFFMPVTVAAVHIAFDFNMVEKLLTLFMIRNTGLTVLCTLGTVLVFFAAYGAVYLLTARTYYKIVER